MRRSRKLFIGNPCRAPGWGMERGWPPQGPSSSPLPVHSETLSRVGLRREQLSAQRPFHPLLGSPQYCPPPLTGICTVKSGGGEGVCLCPAPSTALSLHSELGGMGGGSMSAMGEGD